MLKEQAWVKFNIIGLINSHQWWLKLARVLGILTILTTIISHI